MEELDGKIKTLTDKMFEDGVDAKTVAKIVDDKDAVEARSAKLYQEVSEMHRWMSHIHATT